MIINGGRRGKVGMVGLALGISLTTWAVVAVASAGATVPSISGNVTAAAGGGPLAGICVNSTPVGGGSGEGGVTDSSGNYSLPNGAPGSYVVEFSTCAGGQHSAGNYGFQYYNDSTTSTAAQLVPVSSGSTTTGINAALVAGGTITGTVTAAAGGTDLAGICVSATLAGDTGYHNAYTAADGTYTISSLAAGNYTVEFFSGSSGCTAPGTPYAPQWYNNRTSQGNADPVAVAVGQVTSNINAALTATTPSATAVSVSPSPVTQGQTVTFSATVSGAGGTPSGSVTFSSSYGNLCVATLNPSTGAGSCTATNAPLGAHTITGSYSGDEQFSPSTGSSSLSVIAPPPIVPPVSPPPVSPPSSPSPSHGYWLVGGDGGIFTFGSAQFHGSTGSMRLSRPVVGITPTADHGGYWLVASDGGIFSFGDAGFFGSIPGLGLLPAGTPGNVRRLNAPVVGMVPSTDGGGYFMVASDGGVFAFGDAHFEGSCPAIGGCSGAAVAVMPDASGNGYWLVTATGHVYSFGDAAFYGAPGPQSAAVTAAVRTPDGNGYWILLADGAVFAYGDATYYGGLAGGVAGGANPANAIFATSDGGGYWIGTANGAVYPEGDAPSDGSMAGQHLNAPIIAAFGW